MTFYRPKTDPKTSFVSDEKPERKEKPKLKGLKRVAIKKKAPKPSNHREVYMDFFEYETNGDVICEIPGCGKAYAQVHHIDCRGMGGTTHVYTVEELMGLCHAHHEEYGDKKQWMEFLKTVHAKFIAIFQKNNRKG